MSRRWNHFENYVQAKMTELPIAGLAVAVSQHGETVYTKGFGYRNLLHKEPVTPETIFGIASVTKSFTALAIMKLEDEGLLDLNDPVVKYLPEFKLHGVQRMSDIKIYHLLSHTTGLAPVARKEELNRLDEHLTYLATIEGELLGQPGEFFSYCNDTFILAGAIIERITDRLYRRYITEHVLNPIGMYRSTYSLEELKKYENVATPYLYSAASQKYIEQPWPLLGNYEVGGGIRSSALDLIRYGNALLGLQTIDGQPSTSIRKMWSHLHKVRVNSYYGYAFQVTPNYEGVTLVEHGGAQPGVSSNFGFIPEQQLVVSVLCNVSNIPVDDIWLAAVNTVLRLPVERKRYVVPESVVSPEVLERLTGTYSSAEGAVLKIQLQNGRPIAEANGEQLKLKTASSDTLVLEQTGKTLQFYFREGQKAWAVLFGMRMLIRNR